MKAVTELFRGLSGLVDGDASKGSRKLEVTLLGLAIMAWQPGIALGVGVAVAGFCIGRGTHDAALATVDDD